MSVDFAGYGGVWRSTQQSAVSIQPAQQLRFVSTGILPSQVEVRSGLRHGF